MIRKVSFPRPQQPFTNPYLSQSNRVRVPPFYFFKILFNISLPLKPRFSDFYISSVFPCLSPICATCLAELIFHDHPSNIWRGVKVEPCSRHGVHGYQLCCLWGGLPPDCAELQCGKRGEERTWWRHAKKNKVV